jgi:hypothetical protein
MSAPGPLNWRELYNRKNGFQCKFVFPKLILEFNNPLKPSSGSTCTPIVPQDYFNQFACSLNFALLFFTPYFQEMTLVPDAQLKWVHWMSFLHCPVGKWTIRSASAAFHSNSCPSLELWSWPFLHDLDISPFHTFSLL